MLSGWKSSLQMDAIPYERFVKKMFCTQGNKRYNGWTRLTPEKAERDKDSSEQQWNKNIRSQQSPVKETGSLALKSVQI